VSSILPPATQYTQEDDLRWAGSGHGFNDAPSITLDGDLFTDADDFPDGQIRSGSPLGKVTATGKFGPYDNTASDGRQTLVGLLPFGRKREFAGQAIPAALYEHGPVVESYLPLPVDSAGKTDVAGRLWFR